MRSGLTRNEYFRASLNDFVYGLAYSDDSKSMHYVQGKMETDLQCLLIAAGDLVEGTTLQLARCWTV